MCIYFVSFDKPILFLQIIPQISFNLKIYQYPFMLILVCVFKKEEITFLLYAILI